MQRFAPHIPPAPQSALLAHGAFGVGPPAHVSHGQSNCEKPDAVQGRVASLMLVPVVVDPEKAAAALLWATQEMETRYRMMREMGVPSGELAPTVIVPEAVA